METKNYAEEENSPETSEFLTLERELAEDEKRGLQNELENRLEERKRSINGEECQMTERRQLRSFSRADEYLYAMKEDLSEWLNLMYDGIDIDAENFMDKLETGEHLIKHANAIRQKHREFVEKIRLCQTKRKYPSFSVPEKEIPLRENVPSGSWFARDNVYNFILFCRLLGVMECIMFETEDLVCRKNEKHVILTLLDVARRGAKLGMLAPILVQFEHEIDREIAREEKEQQKREEKERKEEERRLLRERNEDFNSMQVNIDGSEISSLHDFADEDFLDEEVEEEEEEEDYNYPIGPLPQLVTNDLKSLDEMVRELVSDCQCPSQFPVIRVSEGKYRIGDSKVLIFVRILRNHVMVRVGGGWDTLQHYLDKHDPCRCRLGHKATVGAHLTTRTGKGPMAVGVCYDRSETPSTPGSRRRSSASNSTSRRSSSVAPAEKIDKFRCASPLSNGIRQVPRSVSRDVLNRTHPPTSLSAKQPTNKKSSKQNFQPITKSMSDRSDSSCSIPSTTTNIGDSGSEVSDEGYKSCQGVIKPSTDAGSLELLRVSSSSGTEQRPDSSLSECSSTISSDEERSSSDLTWRIRHESAETERYDDDGSNERRCSSSFETATPVLSRSRSISSVRSGSTDLCARRSSYRNASSRYMQAAEAYSKRSSSVVSTGPVKTATTPVLRKSNSGYGTWSGRWEKRAPSPAQFARPRQPLTPQPQRRRFGSGVRQPSSSVHATPCRKSRQPPPEEEEDEILKKMEEILMTYKSQVEGRLAAEGRQLPKEIFEDFTSHWVNSTNTERKPSLPSPSPRKEFRENKERTKIPLPTFYDRP